MLGKISNWLVVLLTLCVLSENAKADANQGYSEEAAINHTLDSMHAAASKADLKLYLVLFTETGVFMGTDDWERWSRPDDFDAYVTERFKDGIGWSYHAIERHVNVSLDGKTAWIDEITESEKWGKFRGTGVLIKEDEGWRIAHYAMSFLVPNEVWEQVSEISKKAFDQRGKK